MTTIRSILCVIDPTTETQHALGRAVWFAKRMGAELRILHCHYDELLRGHQLFGSELFDQLRKQEIARQDQRLAKLAAPIREAGITCEYEVVWDHPLDEGIAKYAIEKDVDIVFKDTHQHPVLGFGRLTNTDWCLMRSCPMPLWFVKPHDLPDDLRFIAAIDPFNLDDKHADLDKEILSLGYDMTQSCDAELHAFHAFDARAGLAVPKPESLLPTESIEDRVSESVSQIVNEIAKTAELAADNIHIVAGSPHMQLPFLAAKLDAAAVIMGAVSRNRLKRLFIGATAEVTLDRLHCDLVVVKPRWAASAMLNSND